MVNEQPVGMDTSSALHVNRRLFEYGLQWKKQIIIALVMLAVSVVADLTGPFVAKTMIDMHIVGIERTWYAVPSATKEAVEFQSHWYERADYLPAGATHGNAVSLLQVGRSFYFVPRALPYKGQPEVHGQRLTVHRGQQSLTVPVVQLTARQLFSFYRPEIPRLWRLALIYVLLIVISSAFTYGQSYLLQVAANRILQTMRTDVFRQVHRLPINYFDNMPAGKVVSRITNDTEAVRDYYVTVLANLFSSVVNMAGIYVALFILNVPLALVCVVLVPILWVWIWLYRRYAGAINLKIRRLLGDINGMLNEAISGVPVIRAFNREKRTLDEFQALNEDFNDAQNRLLAVNSATGYNLTSVIRNIFFIALISYFGWKSFHLAGAISFGTLYAFVDYLNRLFQPVMSLVNQFANLEQARVSAARVFELLEEPGIDVVDGNIPRYHGDVVFEDVFFSYDGKRDVLKGISFEAKQGQTVALVGHTGSGKSSIMNLLFRFYDARQGRITIDGMDITTIERQHLRKHMGIVLQDPFLFTGTIATNVSLEDPEIHRDRVDKALSDVGADRLLGQLPAGWDEPVLEKGSTLSGGQRQLISFARALAFDPAILVLDEATSNIDTETETVIQQALDVLKAGRTTFIIAHRLSTIRNADLILVLDHGAIVERGTHEELMGQGGRYYHMYQLQQGNVTA